MRDPFSLSLKKLSRREFLKMTGSALLGLFLLPDFAYETELVTDTDQGSYGRVTAERLLVFNRPSKKGQVVKVFHRDMVLPITRITIGEGEPSYNRMWYEMNGEGFVHSGSVQPVQIRKNPVVDSFPKGGMLAEVTVPYTDTVWNLNIPGQTAYRLYYSTTHWVMDIVEDKKGKKWYQVHEDKWHLDFFAEPKHFHFITKDELSPLSPNVPPREKRIEIRLDNQMVIAYEEDQPVFMTRTATGALFSDGDYRTQKGRYHTNRKRPSRHMAAGDLAAPNSYDLPGVPWVCYLTKSGVSFHGTYWHNDYGHPRSHGCINLSPEAAKWIYRWCQPRVPYGVDYWEELEGTRVDVI